MSRVCPCCPAWVNWWQCLPASRLSLNILVDQSETLSGRYVLPLGPEPARRTDDEQSGAFQAAVPATEASLELRSQGFWPAAPARIADEAWLRDQRLVRIAFSPFQYDPASGQIVWHRLLRVELSFVGDEFGSQKNSADDPNFESIYRASLVNYDSSLAMRAKAPSPLAPSPDSREASTATRYRIVVDHPGIYRLTYSDLQGAGLPVDQVNPQYLQLTNQGRAVAIQVTGEGDGSFDPGDEILFYGEAFHGDVMASTYASEDDSWYPYYSFGQAQLTPEYFERYTDENIYWLWVQTSQGSRMPDPISGQPSGNVTIPQVFTDTVRAEQSHRYWSFHFTSQDPWVWDDLRVTDIQTQTYTITLKSPALGNYPAVVQGELVGDILYNPNHHTRITLNNDPQIYADDIWYGGTRHHFSAQAPQSMLREGSNDLHLTVINDPSTFPADRLAFDWFSIDYARLFQADSDQLFFERDEAGQDWKYHITNFSSAQLQVYDITNPLVPQPVNGFDVSSTVAPVAAHGAGFYPVDSGDALAGATAYELAFQANHPGQTSYLVLAAPAIQSPKSISAYTAGDLYDLGNGTDYIVIAPSALITASQTLADYRASQGMRTMVVDLQDIFNQFNYGIYHPLAIKRFLSYAYQNWQAPAPAYVLLVGDGHWNFKGYTGNTTATDYGYIDPTIYMPPYMAWVDPWQGEVDSSSLLATVSGTDILPDLSIARLPVNSVDQLQTVIAKTIAYESTPGQSWQRRLLFTADNPDTAGDFDAYSESVISQSTPPDYSIDRIYLDTFPLPPPSTAFSGPAAAYAITTTLNTTGTLFINFIGHGAISRWASEGLLVTTGDPAFVNLPSANYITTLKNRSQLPVMVSMDCLDGYWNYATEAKTSLAEEMVRAPAGGAVAAYAPTGLGVASGHDILNRGFYGAIFEDGIQTFGPATLSSKLALWTTGYHYDLVDTFTAFGDPALRFLTTVAPVQAEQNFFLGGVATYNLQVTNTDVYTGAPIVDNFTLSAHGNNLPVSISPSTLSLLPGETANVQVRVILPDSAPAYFSDSVRIDIHSSRLGSVIASANLITFRDPDRYLFLPVAVKP